MWKHLYQTLSYTLRQCNSHYAGWMRSGYLFGRVFLAISIILSFVMLYGVMLFVVPAWMPDAASEEMLYYILESAVSVGFNVMILGCAMLAARLRSKGMENAFRSFPEFSRSVPMNGWNFYLISVILTSLVYFFILHLTLDRPNGGDANIGAALFRNVDGAALRPWFRSLLSWCYALCPFVLAGILYLKTAGLPLSAIYRPSFITLLITGFACQQLASTTYTLIANVLLQPVLILMNSVWIRLLLLFLLQALVYLPVMPLFIFLTDSAFRENEEVLDIEGEQVRQTHS